MNRAWSTVPLWTVIKDVRSVIDPVQIDGDVFHYSIPAVDETGTGLIESAASLASAKLKLNGGEVLISKLNPRKGRVLICRPHTLPVVASPEFIAFRVGDSLLDRYLQYILRSETTRQYLDSHVQSATRSHQRVTPELVRHMNVTLPPVEEQRRIADFLDQETACINQAIALRDAQAANLAEALKSESSRLTGRLFRNQSPARWDRVPLRRVVASVQTGLTPTDLLQPLNGADSVPWYTPAALDGVLGLDEPGFGVQRVDFGEVPRFSAGSVLIVGIGESLGKVAMLNREATGNQQLTCVEVQESTDAGFLAWQLYAAYDEIRSWAQYSRVRILNNDNLLAFPMMIPPIQKQVAARAELDGRLDDLKAFRAAADRFHALASERRQALISAGVTGQIDVTTVRGVSV